MIQLVTKNIFTKAFIMATPKKVWVYTLAVPVSGLEDMTGNEEKHPLLHHIYVADETNPEIASDGSKKLFHSASGIIEPYELNEILKQSQGGGSGSGGLTGLTLTGTVTGAVGSKGQLTVAPKPTSEPLPSITYASDDTSVATIDSAGKISFVKGGFVTFTATGGGKSASIDGETTTANATAFVSAEIPVSSGGWHVDVTLSDDKGYGSDTSAWELKVNGKTRTDIFVTGHDTTKFQVRFVAGTTNLIKKSDVVLVSHKSAEGGVAKFTDQPVTNNLP